MNNIEKLIEKLIEKFTVNPKAVEQNLEWLSQGDNYALEAMDLTIIVKYLLIKNQQLEKRIEELMPTL